MSPVSEFTRLPNDVVPVNYQLEFKPNIADFTFTGKEVVDVKVNKNHQPTTQLPYFI